ncbi:MAG: cell division protein FtsL [Pseudomonadota bacterium]
MNRIAFTLSIIAVVATAAWAYHVNYETAEALDEARRLERAVERQRERLAVLRVEWAKLNAPGRLRQLVARHNGRLLLMPIASDHYGETAAIPYPPRNTTPVAADAEAEVRP